MCHAFYIAVNEMTHEGDQGHPKLAHLLDDSLCGTIRSRGDNPNMSPMDIEDATQRLQTIEEKKGELSHDSDQLVGRLHKLSSRPCRHQREPGSASSYHLDPPSYNDGYFSVQHLSIQIDARKRVGHTMIKMTITITQRRLRKHASAVNCTRVELRAQDR